MQIDHHSTELEKKQKRCLFMKYRVQTPCADTSSIVFHHRDNQQLLFDGLRQSVDRDKVKTMLHKLHKLLDIYVTQLTTSMVLSQIEMRSVCC